jgi:hypothetical protein
MKKNAIIIFLFLPFLLKSQIKTDTLFSGKKLYVDFSESKINLFNETISQNDICIKVEKIEPKYQHLKLQAEGFKKAYIPYLLITYNKISKSKILMEYDAIIFSSYLSSEEYMGEIFMLEFFFDTRSNAQLCEKTINDLISLRKEEEKKDKKILIGTYNWFCLSNNNRVYFIHYMHEETLDCQIVKNFSKKLLSIINNK